MADVTVSVTSTISLDLRVLRWLKSIDRDVQEYIGMILLFTTVQHPRRFLWMKYVTSRRLLIGELHFDDKHNQHASPSKNWVIRVFGPAYVEEMKELATRLSSTFRVKVHVRLEAEQPRDLKKEAAWGD